MEKKENLHYFNLFFLNKFLAQQSDFFKYVNIRDVKQTIKKFDSKHVNFYMNLKKT